jgi:GTP pyrophosphokinase
MRKTEEEILAHYFKFLDLWNPDPADKEIIRRAALYANQLHHGVSRKSGDPYILHPLEVATIVAKDLEMDTASIVAAILHDVVEDTDQTRDDIAHHFGEEVASIVEGLTKIDKARYDGDKPKLKVENIKKLLESFVNDPRVIIIKLADRLHNMRTLEAMRIEKQQSIASETEWLFIPLAHRLGLGELKRKLGNETVKYSQQKKYQQFKAQLSENRKIRKVYTADIKKDIYQILDNLGVPGRIKIREASAFDLLQLMGDRSIHDVKYCSEKFTLQIIFESSYEKEKEIAFKIYSGLSLKYLYNTINDYISIPRTNDYRALETAFIKPYKGEDKEYQGHWINVAIMSERMYEIANKGYALRYNRAGKKDYIKEGRSNIENWLKAIGKLTGDVDRISAFFLKRFEGYISMKNVVVFTRSGERKNLPEGSTALDFAYAIQTKLGNKTAAVLINNEPRSIFHVLKNKDIVNIIPAKQNQVKENWLDNVKTGRAMKGIYNALSKKFSQHRIEGEETLQRHLKKLGIEFNDANVQHLMEIFNINRRNEFLFQVFQEQIQFYDIEKGLQQYPLKTNHFFKVINWILPGKTNKISNKDNHYSDYIIHKDKEIIMDNVKISHCCYPVPGDPIIGVPISNEKTKIHHMDCVKTKRDIAASGGVSMDVRWKNNKGKSNEYLAAIQLFGTDEKGLLDEIVNVISHSFEINMKQIEMNAYGKTIEARVLLYINGVEMLNGLIRSLANVEYITEVRRILDIHKYFHNHIREDE